MRIVWHKVKQKALTNTGASIVLALLVFLFCAVVGSTVLAASMSSSGTLTTTWQSDKDVYLLKSAASIVDSSFSGKTWKSSEHSISENKIQVSTSSTMDNLYEALCAQTYNTGSANQSIVLTLGNTTISTTPVNATMVMDDGYNVTVIYSKTGSIRQVTQYFQASTADSTTTQGKGSNVTWLAGVITVQ